MKCCWEGVVGKKEGFNTKPKQQHLEEDEGSNHSHLKADNRAPKSLVLWGFYQKV